MTWLAGVVVVTTGLWLVGFALLIVVAPVRAERFLKSFASSARTHYTEQVLQLIAGSGIVAFSFQMRFPDLFKIFGWLIVVTAIGLLLVPWQWHRRFGQWAIPLAIRHIKLYALGSFVLGTLILLSMFPK